MDSYLCTYLYDRNSIRIQTQFTDLSSRAANPCTTGDCFYKTLSLIIIIEIMKIIIINFIWEIERKKESIH